MIIALSGYAGSGKDAAANIIKKLHPYFEIKKFSGKMKKIASILTGIPEAKFEDQDVKKSLLGPEWGEVRENPLNAIDPFSDVEFLHLMSVRELLQKLGTDAIRSGLHQNAWVNALMADYRAEAFSGYVGDTRMDVPASSWVITDCRFPNEANAVVSRGGVIVRITRPGFGPVNNHPSETALDGWPFDFTLTNDGSLENFEAKIVYLLNQIHAN